MTPRSGLLSCIIAVATGCQPSVTPRSPEPAARETVAGPSRPRTSAPSPPASAEPIVPNPEPVVLAPPPEPPCDETAEPQPYYSETGPAEHFSVEGYLARALRLEHDTTVQTHCVTVLWPPGDLNSDSKPSRVAEFIDAAWVRALTNTLARVPWKHRRVLRRVVIDNRPKEHGIAAHDRNAPDDERDGHTLWLHEDVFRQPNHWARGNYGTYWSYHTSEDQRVIDGADPQHTLYSPVILHELGHLVNYSIVNEALVGPEAADAPPCARTCVERGGCKGLSPLSREQGCISPYCTPFRFESNLENWAEQYRFFYQSSETRGLLESAGVGCIEELRRHDGGLAAPWSRSLPDAAPHRPSRWDSCGGRACKPW